MTKKFIHKLHNTSDSNRLGKIKKQESQDIYLTFSFFCAKVSSDFFSVLGLIFLGGCWD